MKVSQIPLDDTIMISLGYIIEEGLAAGLDIEHLRDLMDLALEEFEEEEIDEDEDRP